MFLELSLRKLALLGLFALTIVGVASFTFVEVYVNNAWQRRSYDAFALARADLWYLVRYQIPWESGRLLAAVGAADIGEAASATTTAQAIPVLLYHGEGPASDMPTSVFVAQLEALKEAGWQTITYAEFEQFMQGKITLPAKSFLLTFDDGRTDTYYAADPLLKSLGYTATMFVITGFSLPANADTPINNFYLDKAQLEAMAASGRWTLESHGNEDHRLYAVPTQDALTTDASTVPNGHFLSDKFWLSAEDRSETGTEFATRIENDLTTAKTTLGNDFGAPVTGFAYPLNDYGDDTVNFPGAGAIDAQIVPSVYRYAFYQTWNGDGDVFNYPDPSAWFVKRFEPQADWTGADLVAYLNAVAPKPLPYAPTNFARGWDGTWGALDPEPSGLAVAAATSTTGGTAYLEGSESWTDYHITADANVSVGTLSLVARETEAAAPYFVCAFSENRIYLERHVGTTQTTLATLPYAPPKLPAAIEASMSVSGASAACSAYGVSVSATDASVPRSGGVGVSVWDPYAGEALARVTSFSVTAL